jgi:5-methylcytosine-specific restriction endonuclease McrA
MRTLRTQKMRDYEKKYREKMYNWVNRLKNKHRVKLKGLDGDFSLTQWDELKARYNNRCAMCGKEGPLTYDHIIPLSHFKEWAEKNHPDYRANDIENIQPLCSFCNGSKGSKV